MNRVATIGVRSALACIAAALLIVTAAQAASTVGFTLELQDADAAPYSTYVSNWKASAPSAFPPGLNSDGQIYHIGDIITWDALIAASGTQNSGAGAGSDIYGVANYVFDIEIRECLTWDGSGACTSEGALVGTAVFQSRINDGTGSDPTREAAFAVSYDVDSAGPARIIDPAASGGPNLSQYNISLTTSTGTLVGLGSGYGVPWIASTMRPGVGMVTLPNSNPGLGIVPVEEGQIDTSSMPAGTYVLKLIPDDGFGMNVLRGDVDLTQDQQAFATGAEVVNGDTVTFFLQAPVPKPVLQAAVSRKTHASGAGDWDIDVGGGDIECRSSQVNTVNPNELTLVATFDIDIGLLGGSDVVADVGVVSSANQTGTNELTISVTGLTFNTQVNLTFPGVVEGNTLDPTSASDSLLCVRIIVGDYDNLGRTNFLDFAQVKNAGYLNQLVDTVDKARADFDCGGRPSFLDFSKVKNQGLINQTAPACPNPPIGP